MKRIVTIVIVFVVIVGIALILVYLSPKRGIPEDNLGPAAENVFNDESPTDILPNSSSDSATEVSVKGAIVSVDMTAIAFDGPTLITLMKTNGQEAVIAIPSMGLSLCVARGSIVDVYDLEAGMEIEARGTWTSEGEIVPCESESHYLRIVR